MDTEYLKAAVGDALSTGIAETVLMRPGDPVDYLAQRLLKWVEDSHSKKDEIAEEEAAKEKQVRVADASAVVQREAEKTAKDTAAKVEKEDDRLAKLLEAASSSAEVLNASLEYLRGRLGASVYVAMTDPPDKLIPLQEPVVEGVAPAAEGEAVEGEAAAGEAAEGEEAAEGGEGEEAAEGGEAEAEAEAEGAEPPPVRGPFVPKVVVYEAATENDRKTLVGKTLLRPAVPEGEEENEEAVHDTFSSNMT